MTDDRKIANSAATAISEHVFMHFAGPLPPPDMLLQYGSVQPDFPERIVIMAEHAYVMVENEQKHRHVLELKSMEYSLRQQEDDFKKTQEKYRAARKGQWFTFVLIVLYFALLAFLGYCEQTTAVCVGLGAGMTAVCGLAYVFIVQKQQRHLKNGSELTQQNITT